MPSSHYYPVFKTLFPHVNTQALPGVAHVYPASMRQVAPHPSAAITLPSSHVYPVSIALFPQSNTQALPGVAHVYPASI